MQKRPNEVDFTESTDVPIGNMEDVMSKKMKERETELSNITDRYNQNHDQLNGFNKNKSG